MLLRKVIVPVIQITPTASLFPAVRWSRVGRFHQPVRWPLLTLDRAVYFGLLLSGCPFCPSSVLSFYAKQTVAASLFLTKNMFGWNHCFHVFVKDEHSDKKWWSLSEFATITKRPFKYILVRNSGRLYVVRLLIPDDEGLLKCPQCKEHLYFLH